VRDRIVVTEVLLDVLVTDKQGNVVTGLGPDDFVVNEEGKSQPVTGATFYGSSEELRGSGIAGEVRSDRYFIFMVHDLRQILPELLAAQIDLARWAKRWVEEEMLPNDQVAVVSYNNRLKLYQDFTRDPAAVAKAIEKAALGKKELDLFKTRSAPTFDPDSPSLFVNLPTGKELMRQTLKLQEALGLLGRAAEGIVGRKNLMLFSLGWDDPEESLSGWIPDPRYYPEMKESLNAGNVAVYSIDLLGSRRGGFSSQSSINDSLSSISNDTGGHYYYNFTNALTPLRQVAEDNQGYYLLSYSSEYPNGQKGYREVEIETRNKDYKVRARKGYRYGNNQGGS
jgi:VWFA-related protein